MATGIGNGLTQSLPTKENDYWVSFKDWGDAVSSDSPEWINPLAGKVFPTYIPCPSTLKEDFTKEISFENRNVICLDLFVPSLITLAPNDLCSLSLVSKCCYVALRADAIWSGKVQDLLPNVRCISLQKCTFSPEQQFQIVFKKIQNRKAPFELQYQHWQTRFTDKIAAIEACDATPEGKKNATTRANAFFAGLTYEGTAESIHSWSKVGQCLYALKMIPEEFDDQTIFEEIILGAQQAAANTAPILDAGYVEEMAEGDLMGPEDDCHLSLITEIFSPESNPTEDQIQGAFSTFGKIEYAEFKMKAFCYILMNPSLKSDAAKAFCLGLPEPLRKLWLDKILEKNNNSTVFEGQDHGNGFFDHMIYVAANSKIAQEAAFEVFVALENKNRES